MRRQAVLTFIPFKQRRAIRRAIFASSQSTQTLSVRSRDPDTTRPFDSAATHETCARRGVDERSMRCSTGRRRRAVRPYPPYTRNVWRQAPVDGSQTLSVLSRDPDTTRSSGRAATPSTCAPRGVDEQLTHGSTGRRRRAESVCPRNVWWQAPLNPFQTLSVLSHDPDTMRPFGRTATQSTCARRGVDERSTRCVDWTPAPRCVRVPAQRPAAPFARHVPDLERVVARPGHNVAVRQGGDAHNLRPSWR